MAVYNASMLRLAVLWKGFCHLNCITCLLKAKPINQQMAKVCRIKEEIKVKIRRLHRIFCYWFYLLKFSCIVISPNLFEVEYPLGVRRKNKFSVIFYVFCIVTMQALRVKDFGKAVKIRGIDRGIGFKTALTDSEKVFR